MAEQAVPQINRAASGSGGVVLADVNVSPTTWPAGSGYFFDHTGDYTALTVPYFDVVITASGTGTIQWLLTFDYEGSTGFYELRGFATFSGPEETYRHQVVYADMVFDYDLPGAETDESLTASMVDRIADNTANGASYNHAWGEFRFLFDNATSLVVSRMELVFPISDETPTRLRRRPLRQFPRSDGLGMSSTRRQDASRSMQASLRRGGGVYF